MFKPKNSKYWHYSIMVNGKIVRGSTKTTNKALALQIEAKKRNELVEHAQLKGTEPINLYRAIDVYLESRKNNANYKLQRSIANIMKKSIADKPLHSITTHDIGKWHIARKRENRNVSTLRNDFVMFRSMNDYIKTLGYSPATNIDFPKIDTPKPRLRFLSNEEEQRLLNHLAEQIEKSKSTQQKERNQDAYDIAFVLLRTGARYSEIANIRWADMDFVNQQIRLYRPKVKNESILFMDEQTKQVLTKRWANRKSNEFVFTSKDGKKSRGYCRNILRDALDAIGCEDANIHTLRHSFASKLAQNGFSLQEIGQMLGHAHINTTMRYSHLVSTDVAKKVSDFFNNKVSPENQNVIELKRAVV